MKKDKKDNTKNDAKKEAFLVALEKSAGIISTACKSLTMSRETYYKWIEEDEVFAEKVAKINEVVGDFVESKLYELINGAPRQVIIRTQEVKTITDENGKTYDKVINVSRPITIHDAPDNASIIFWLKTRGKSRGYTMTEGESNSTGGMIIIES